MGVSAWWLLENLIKPVKQDLWELNNENPHVPVHVGDIYPWMQKSPEVVCEISGKNTPKTLRNVCMVVSD